MEKTRIEEIRKLADRLADYVEGENDEALFRALYALQKYHLFRLVLIKANLACVKRGGAPIVEFDPYIAVFESGEDVALPDWGLARDLILIRMIEQLQSWLSKHRDATSDQSEAKTEEEADETAEAIL